MMTNKTHTAAPKQTFLKTLSRTNKTIAFVLLGMLAMYAWILYTIYGDTPINISQKFNADFSPTLKNDSLVDKNNFPNQIKGIPCLGRTSKWVNYLAIDCNRDTINASSPEKLLQSFCNTFGKQNKYSSWTSGKFSSVYLQSVEQEANHTISISMQTFDEENKKKNFGYDLIVIRAEQNKGDGRSAGVVVDFKNGSYFGTVNVFWTGETAVYAKVVSPIQNTCLKRFVMEMYGTSKYSRMGNKLLGAEFEKDNVNEFTECSPNPFVFGSKELCNFTLLNDGVSWFCGRPKEKLLKCPDIKWFNGYISSRANRSEEIVKPFVVKFRRVIASSSKAEWKSNINQESACNTRDPIESWKEPTPTGFWLNGSWNFVHCYSTLEHNFDEYRRCLRNTTVIFLGDSTVRQYFNYFRTNILNLSKRPREETYGKQEYHRYGFDKKYGINIAFFKHEMPLYFGIRVHLKRIVSMPGLLDSLKSNKDVLNTNVILLVDYYLHFSEYPPNAFRERVRSLALAVERFLEVKPSTKICFKGHHLAPVYNFDPRNARLFRLIVEEEFANILHKVIYLDTWDITVAHGSTDVHPFGKAFESQIQQFMTYIC